MAHDPNKISEESIRNQRPDIGSQRVKEASEAQTETENRALSGADDTADEQAAKAKAEREAREETDMLNEAGDLEDIGAEGDVTDAGENVHRGHEEGTTAREILRDHGLLGLGERVVAFVEAVVHAPDDHAEGLEICEGWSAFGFGVPKFIFHAGAIEGEAPTLGATNTP